MKVLLFAMHHAQAMHFMREIDPDNRRKYIVLTGPQSEHRTRGQQATHAVFLDDWFRGWPPVAAHTAYSLVRLYGVEHVFERSDLHRRNHARAAFGLTRWTEPEYMVFDLSKVPHPEDGWALSSTAKRFADSRANNASLSALPGLDDKPNSHNPVGGVVFKEIFDIEDPDSAYPLYADWFIRKNIRTPEPYIKEPTRDRDNISAALDWLVGASSL